MKYETSRRSRYEYLKYTHAHTCCLKSCAYALGASEKIKSTLDEYVIYISVFLKPENNRLKYIVSILNFNERESNFLSKIYEYNKLRYCKHFSEFYYHNNAKQKQNLFFPS